MVNGDPPASRFQAYETLPEDAAPGAPVHKRAGDSFSLRRAAYANDAMPERRTDGWEKVKERRESGSPWPFNRRAKTAHVKVEMRRSNSYLRAHYFQFDAAHGALKPQRIAPRMLAKGISVVEWEVLTNTRESIPKILGLTEQIEATVPGDLAKTREIERKVRYASIGSVDDLAGAELNPRLTHCCTLPGEFTTEWDPANTRAFKPRKFTHRTRGEYEVSNAWIFTHRGMGSIGPGVCEGFKPRKFTHRTRGKYEGIKPMHFSASRTGFYGDDPDGKTRSTSSSGIDQEKMT
ncbi:hypothetical protein B0H13DRAFT_1871213 [Mycena leptocephala]|nr:hypothetical protein B0H13DRAFT_1871213 [Mycena leptocephala]